jgi:hypothetical protein
MKECWKPVSLYVAFFLSLGALSAVFFLALRAIPTDGERVLLGTIYTFLVAIVAMRTK